MSRLAAALAALYLFVEIPIFAALYAHYRTEFHVATTRFEPGSEREAQALLDSLQVWLGPPIRERIERRTDSTVRQLSFSDLASGFQQASFVAHPYVERSAIAASRSNGRSWAFPVYDVQVSWAHGYPLMSRDAAIPGNGRGEMLLELTVRPIQTMLGGGADTLSPELIIAPAPQDLFARLWTWVDQRNGTPHDRGWDATVRWTYLSVVCITTLGLGDVVPITTRSRTLVSLEAVIGIVTAGLFVNSLLRLGTGRR